MTPKEKAITLVNKFSTVGLQQRNEGLACALIAVTEIINAIAFDFENPSENTIYWLKVKQEIENLDL